jgi:chromosomal replication initiation ATPase DnaA
MMSRVDHWADIQDLSTFNPSHRLKRRIPQTVKVQPELIAEIEKLQGTINAKEAEFVRISDELEALGQITGPFIGKRIALTIARAHGVSWSEFVSHRRHRYIVIARHHAAYEMYRLTSLSLPAIGRILKMHHTSILFGIRQHAKRNNLPLVRLNAKP